MTKVRRHTAIYARTSKDEEQANAERFGEKISIRQQVEDAKELIARARANPKDRDNFPGDVVVYFDPGVTGKFPPQQWATGRQKYRKDFTRLIADVIAGKIGALVVRDQKRLARKGRWADQLWDLLKEHDVQLYGTAQSFPRSEDGSAKFTYMVLAAAHEYEVSSTQAVTKRALATLKKHDRKYGPAKDLGYRDSEVKGKVVKDERETKIIREAFDRASTGASCNAIAAWFDAQEWPGRRRKQRFSGSHIKRILTNPHYIGQRRVDGRIEPTSVYEAIVDPSTFWKVQELLRARQGQKHKSGPGSPRLLSGLVYCACGERLHWTRKDGKGEAFTRCQKMHEGCPARLTESIWQEWVECFLVPHFAEVPPQPDDKRAALQVQLDTINENLAALRKAIATASKSVTDEFQKTIEEAVAERTKVEARIAALPPGEAGPFVAWEDMSTDEKRLTLRRSVERIVVHPDTVEVTYAPHWNRQPCKFPVMRRRPVGGNTKPKNCLTPLSFSRREAGSVFVRDLSTVNWSEWVLKPEPFAELFHYANPNHATNAATVGRRRKSFNYQTRDGKTFTADGRSIDLVATAQARCGRRLSLAECKRVAV
jgi:DNA invertase Pin-like site-specific DNA recombinase